MKNYLSIAAERQDFAKSQPDYRISEIADMWAVEIITALGKAGIPPKTADIKKIYHECLNRIHAAIESGELEATYLDEDIIHPILANSDAAAMKIPALWIVETRKYSEWAKANGAGPKKLVMDVTDNEFEDMHAYTMHGLPKFDYTQPQEPIQSVREKVLLDRANASKIPCKQGSKRAS